MLALRLAILLSALLPAVPGCGFLSGPGPSAGSPLHGKVEVEVENHNWSDVTIYLMTGGLPHRLGLVTALSTGSFTFPSHRLHTGSGVRLRALPIAGRPFTSEPVLVQPGQAIMWTLENDLDVSSLSVY
jgi:hypothetical protein